MSKIRAEESEEKREMTLPEKEEEAEEVEEGKEDPKDKPQDNKPQPNKQLLNNNKLEMFSVNYYLTLFSFTLLSKFKIYEGITSFSYLLNHQCI